MAHRGPAKIPGADDRPGGRKPGGFTRDPGLAYSSRQFGGQVAEAITSEGQQAFAITAKFAAAERAAELSAANAEFDAEVVKIETGFESRVDYGEFENERFSGLKIKSGDIEGRLRGEVLRAFKAHAASSGATSKARVTATGRKRMVTQTRAVTFNAGNLALGKALAAKNKAGADFERDTYFSDLDRLGAVNIYSAEEVAKLKLAFKDDLAKGQLSKIILANPFDPQAELAIKNLRSDLQDKALEQLDTARSSWVTKNNQIASRQIAKDKRITRENRIKARRDMLVLLFKFDQNNGESRAKGLLAAEALYKQTLLDAVTTNVDAATLDAMKDSMDSFREGRVSPPGGLNEALIAVNNEDLVSETDPRFIRLSHTDRLTVSSRLATKNAEGQKHFSAQDIWKQGNDSIRARIEAANPIAPNAADTAVLKNQIAIKVKLAQSLYSARAYDAKDRGEMMQDLARLKPGKYNVFNEVEAIANIVATPSSAEVQIKVLIEEKNVILLEIKEKYARVLELIEAEEEAQKISEEKAEMIISPHFAKMLEIDPRLRARISFLDQRINILNSLGTSPGEPAQPGLQSSTLVE
jgi:mRNA-degrading endonuclease RelE of RelBE toxin-antitoxin system